MDEKRLKDIALSCDFEDIHARLNLTRRQDKIFVLRYRDGLLICDIAAELGYCTKTISDELKEIRSKMAQIDY